VADHRLVLIRHAKSADGPVDLGRALTPRGHRDARAAGRWLAGTGFVPDLIVVSPARRAVQTWDEIAAHLDGVPAPTIDDRIYGSSVDVLLDVIHAAPVTMSTLALVGHNPAIRTLANLVDDGLGDSDARRELDAGYPTCGIAVFDVSVAWIDIGAHTGRLEVFTAPRG
jgi:phosphohistidine phosphatase